MASLEGIISNDIIIGNHPPTSEVSASIMSLPTVENKVV
jgi:hypothetical protein